MIGIVVVSHSRALAEAAVALAEEMVQGGERPVVSVAAGLDETTFGTDAAAVADSIGASDSPDGVLVLLDLGSAVLSAEMALEFVDSEVAKRVVLCSAPLVEGLVAAVVLASTGASIEEVAAEARGGLAAKQDHLGDVAPAEPAAEEVREGARVADRSIEIDVVNEHGLHARPAARLVALVRTFDADVGLTNLDTGRGPVDAASLSRVATLNAGQGGRLRVSASGPESEEALEAVRALAERGFDDVVAAGPRAGPKAGGGSRGVSAGESHGSGLDLAIGPAIVPAQTVDVSGYAADAPDVETARSERAVAATVERLRQVGTAAAREVGEAEADIFDAQLTLLEDPVVTGQVAEDLAGGASAVEAWSGRLDALAADFEGLDDAYQRARAQDVRSVRRRLLLALTGQDDREPEGHGILVVPEIDAATAATVDAGRVLGIATRSGGATGHGVIVAKSRGIPIITDVGEPAGGVQPGVLVAFDAQRSVFLVDPDEAEQADFRRRLEERSGEHEAAVREASAPARTADGCAVRVVANVGSVDDALVAAGQGAEGSGLVRTEVLFGDRATVPTVDEQAEAFRGLSAALGGRPITIRTWDVGGDKPLAFLPQPAEANPFLGDRGLRTFRRRPELLDDQLRAVCLVARDAPVHVMFPMVTTVEEVEWARSRLVLAARSTTGAVPAGLRVGVMIEVPAAALRARLLAADLDFVSIGTNDLTQYTTAADRANGAVSGLADALDPAVLELVSRVCRTVPPGVEVAVCGDLASDAAAAVLLMGLGVRELSAVGPQIPAVKVAIRSARLDQAEELARQALAAPSAGAVHTLLHPSSD